MKACFFLILLALALLLPSRTQAATWVGGTANWNVAGNWSPNGVPDVNTGVVINTGTPTLDVEGVANTLLLQNAAIADNGTPHSLTCGGLFTMNSGAFIGRNSVGAQVTVNANGGVAFSGGRFYNSVLNIASGTIFTQSNNLVEFYSNGTVNNAGTVLLNALSGFYGNGSGAPNYIFNNSGIITKQTNTGLTTISFTVNNTGTVNAKTGTLQLLYGGAHTGGIFNVVSGATLQFNGAHTFDSASSIQGQGSVNFSTSGTATLVNYSVDTATIIGAGTTTFNNGVGSIGTVTSNGAGTANFNGTANPTSVTVNGGGVLNFANNISTSTLTITNGSLSSATGKTFNASGLFDIQGGTLKGGGNFNANGGMSITGGPILNGATVNNPNGSTATHASNTSLLMQGNTNTFNNAGIYNVTSTNNSNISGNGGTNAFNNSGTFNRTTGTNNFTISVPFNNTGIVNVNSASLVQLFSGGTHVGGAFNISAAGATLQFSGAHSFDSNTFISGAGSVNYSPSNTITLLHSSVGTATIIGGGVVNMNDPSGTLAAVTVSGGTANFNGNTSPTSVTCTSGIANFANPVTTNAVSVTNATLNCASGKSFVCNGVLTFGTSGSTLSGGGVFTANAGVSAVSGATINNAVLSVPSGQTFTQGSTANINNNATINNAGTFLAQSSSGLSPNIGTNTFNNSGTFTRNTSATAMGVSLPFNNTGTMDIQTGSINLAGGTFTQTAGLLRLNGGAITVGTAPLAINGGTLAGTGTITGKVNITAGIVSPQGTGATATATLAITDDLTFTVASKLRVDLGGTTVSTQYDRVTEAGTVAFARNGMLEVGFVNGFEQTVAAGDTFTILTSNQNTTGQFSNVVSGRINTLDFKGSFAVNAAGSTSVVLSNFQAYPDIDVEQPTGTPLADGASTVDYGIRTVATGTARTFTITNSGRANLTGLGITISGTNASEFTLTTPVAGAPNATLLPAGTTTFIVTFTPAASGPRSAQLQIASNDPNEAPFDIALIGTGNLPPVLNLPVSPVTVDPADTTGADVTFSVTATDVEDDPDPAAIATPASGSHFALGDTAVNVTSTDSGGALTSGSFTVHVNGGTPLVTTLAPSPLATTSATLRATVNPNFFDTTAWFIADGQIRGTTPIPAGHAPVNLTYNLTGLLPGSAHTCRVQAINGAGVTVDGALVTFNAAGGPPVVSTLAPTMVTPTKATLRATVNPNQVATTVTFYVGGIVVGTVNVPAGADPQTVTLNYTGGIIPGQAVTYTTTATNTSNQNGSGSNVSFNFLASDSTFGNSNNYIFSANAGWILAKPATNYGFRTGDNVCSGFLYAANLGWIHAGNGEPSNGYAYTNTGGEYGVNLTPGGGLRGYAWGQNIGWICFESTGDPHVVLTTGALAGYAWSGNLGWINLGTAITTQLAIFDTDADGISDSWEMSRAGNLATLGANHDADGDGITDLAEYTADTNPLDPTDNLHIVDFSQTGSGLAAHLQFTSTATRLYQVKQSETLETNTWQDAGLSSFVGSAVTTTVNFAGVPADKRFYRVEVRRPLVGP